MTTKITPAMTQWCRALADPAECLLVRRTFADAPAFKQYRLEGPLRQPPKPTWAMVDKLVAAGADRVDRAPPIRAPCDPHGSRPRRSQPRRADRGTTHYQLALPRGCGPAPFHQGGASCTPENQLPFPSDNDDTRALLEDFKSLLRSVWNELDLSATKPAAIAWGLRMAKALDKLQTAAAGAALTVAKCDGNHGGPACADVECWNGGAPRADLQAVADFLDPKDVGHLPDPDACQRVGKWLRQQLAGVGAPDHG